MKKWILAALIITLLAILGLHIGITVKDIKLTSFKKKNANNTIVSSPNIISIKMEEKIIPVKTTTVVTQQFTPMVKVIGTTKAKYDYVISSKLNGEITYLNAEIGSELKKGYIIARIDPEIAAARFNQADANYKMAYRNYKRQKKLARKKLISTQKLESSETSYRVARANLKLAKINLSNSKIFNPINGVIAEKYVNLHEFVSIGSPIARIVNIDKIEIEVGVSEKNIVQIKKGDKAYLKLSSYQKKTFLGYVIGVGMQANEKTKTFPITIEFENTSQEIKGGMIGTVSILTETASNSIVVPFYLLQQYNGEYYVYINENNKSIRKKVTIGYMQEDNVQITSGLNAGEELIITGFNYLSDNSSIKIVE